MEESSLPDLKEAVVRKQRELAETEETCAILRHERNAFSDVIGILECQPDVSAPTTG